MLEVKHLKKVYKTKNGVVTRALDDVSLNFAETGMVFILGKSGSGKSTLLNVCGGLDKADSGEIIIKGKSSKDFSAQDFDSYRNTYVGFVFQEYNILDEFTVEENIALALELQNKKRDKAVIEKILADVDMTSFASRKPNTLSGGQKQRVAIARALVKEPEIIMADEPTGALDSKTGQQVFDTLKKLSETKLVIVISHDRDFAEQYGDRIIELKDGKVISDQTRAKDGEGAKNVRFFGTDTVCVQSGADLTDADLKSIKQFLSKAGGSAVISTSREHISQMKQDRPEMSVGAFEDVTEQPKSKAYPQQKLIRSHLPMRHAVRMGGSSLKTKPVRLVFTILLSVIAFMLFGLASTLMLFDGKSVTKSTLADLNESHIILSKAYWETNRAYSGDKLEYENETKKLTGYTFAEYNELKQKYPGALAGISINLALYNNVTITQAAQQFYTPYLDGVILTDSSINYVKGEAPKKADEIAISDYILNMLMLPKTEVSIEKTGENGVENVKVTVEKAEDIIWSETNPVLFDINNEKYKITGVYKGADVPNVYTELKDAADRNVPYDGNRQDQWMWEQARSSGMFAKLVVTEELIQKLSENVTGNDYFDFGAYFKYSNSRLIVGSKNEQGEVDGNGIYEVAVFDQTSGQMLKLYDTDGNEVTSLGAGQIGIRYSRYAETLQWTYYRARDAFNNDEDLNKAMREAYENAYQEYGETHKYPQYGDYDDQSAYNAAVKKYDADREEYAESARINASGKHKTYLQLQYDTEKSARMAFDAENPEPAEKYTTEWYEWDNRRNQAQSDAWSKANPFDSYYGLSGISNGEKKFTREEILSTIKLGSAFLDEWGYLDGIYLHSEYDGYEEKVTVVGVYFEGSRYSSGGAYLNQELFDKVYISDGNTWRNETFTKYSAPDDAYITAVYVPNTGATLISELVDGTYLRGDDDSSTTILNSAMSSLQYVIDMVGMLSFAFLIAGLVLAVFAFLLMFNFISASITAKKKEIGILRAIGARTTDVFKIFLSEAMIIALICFIISTLGTFGMCIILNGMLVDTAISVSMFVFGPLSVVCILGIALLTAIISTVLPVGIYSRKPPVASIRAL